MRANGNGPYLSNFLDYKKCAKQTTIALLITPSGEFFVGQNWCEKPQKKCPRAGLKTGIGYELCQKICGQKNHAEVDACLKAGKKAHGATLFLLGHTYCCENCLTVMQRHGVKEHHCIGGFIK